MRRDPGQPHGEDDPLDAAFGDLQDLAELEQRFALLDARIEEEQDPFVDIARALREHKASTESSPTDDGDEDSSLAGEDDAQLELSVGSFADDEEDEEDDDPVAAEIEERCHDALDALDLDDMNHARELAMEAVRLDDEHPFPMFVLGLVAEREGDLDTARDMAELSLRTAGTNADAIGLRAHIHVRQHELAEAEQLLRFGIAHNPDDASLHEGLARVSLARGKHEEAVRAAGAALRIEPGNIGAMAVRTAALDEGGDRGALLAALRQGVQLHPEDPYGMVELASVEMEHGNLDRARSLLMRAQRLAPRDTDIGDVRVLVEHVHERRLLRAVPNLLRWMREFPGGMPGFLVGFVVAALPLHALAVSNPAYRIPALVVLGAWGSVALYAWLGPAILTHRLNQRAASTGLERITEELRDPLASLPPIERLVDVLSMLGAARNRRAASALSSLAGERAYVHARRALAAGSEVAVEVAPLLVGLARRLRGPRARIRAIVLAVPALARMLVAVGVLVAIIAPTLAAWSMLPLLAWHGIAAGLVVFAWLHHMIEQAWTRDLDESLATISHAATMSAPRS
jgi:tetratricopeptide (TPR) repeat protein